MTVHETHLRVRYAETDQMGLVYYANYFVWMEVGRAEYCRAAGIVYRDLELETGLYLAVAGAQCRYLAPARYDEEISVRTNIGSANRRMVEFQYEIRRAANLLATGSTRHIFLNRNMKPESLPERYWPAFGIPLKDRT